MFSKVWKIKNLDYFCSRFERSEVHYKFDKGTAEDKGDWRQIREFIIFESG